MSNKKLREAKRRAKEQSSQHEKSLNNPPRSMVFRRGVVGPLVADLVSNLRLVMAPFSALRLKERRHNQLQDFLRVSGPLGVTHFLILSQTTLGVNLRICRVPRGPTLSFRVLNYTLMRSVVKAQKNPQSGGTAYDSSPLVVLNNFSGDDDHKKIMAAVFQNMFPGLDITTLRLTNCRRIVLINYNNETDTIDFRHYYVSAVPVGLTKGIRKVIKGKIPQMHSREDIADYVENPNTMSDSECELPEESRVTLAQSIQGRGNRQNQNSAIKLKELGPRLTLQLVKIEDGVCDGATIYHKFVQKTEIEIQDLEERKQLERELKAQRRAEQEANVLRKQQEKEEKARAKEERKVAREAAKAARLQGEQEDASEDESSEESESESESEIEHDFEDDGNNEYADGLDNMNLHDEIYDEYSDDDKESEMQQVAGKKYQKVISSNEAKRMKTK